MRDTVVPRFRITAWPGVVVPPPPCETSRTYRYAASGEIFLANDLDVEQRPRRHESGETYLKLLRVDLGDPLAILDFINEYDVLGIHEASLTWPSFSLPAEAGNDIEKEIHRSRVLGGRPLVDELREEWDAGDNYWSTMPWEDLPPEWTDPDQAAFHDLESETLTEFRVGATLIRNAFDAWRSARGDNVEPEWSSPAIEDYLINFFDFGLRPFHPGISFLDEDEWPPEGTRRPTSSSTKRVEVVPGSGHARQGLDLYPICCLELYNHIVEEADYRICANETCRRLFVRQEGRAKFAQNRTTGLKYCTALCARAQAQRDYRRRQAKPRE